jgi:hypothetical protein
LSEPRAPPFQPPAEHVLEYGVGLEKPNEPATFVLLELPPPFCVDPTTFTPFAVKFGAEVPPPSFPT